MRRDLRGWLVAGVLAVFVAAGAWFFRGMPGDDLSSSYVGCRLMATGETSHLYRYDPEDFAAVGPDEAWQKAADDGGYESFLHPYVQTPLWAYSLQPLCGRSSFEGFKRWFLVAEMLSFGGCVWLVGRFWAPELMTPQAMVVVLVGLLFSEPFRYAMFLLQTHVLYVLMAIGSLVLAERRRPGWAGFLLAGAAAVKITPGVLVVYWLMTRRWKAAVSFAAWSAVLWVASIVLTGRETVAAYVADVHRISNVLLVAFNNQSFAAWWMGRLYPGEVWFFHMLELPGWLRIGSSLLMVGFAVLGGWIDRRRVGQAPLGAMMALVAATVFVPINWTHYAIVLVVPLMMLVDALRRMERGAMRWWLCSCVVVIAALNFPPLAPNLLGETRGRFSVVRSEFYADMLCLLVLGTTGWMEQGRSKEPRGALID